MNRVSTILLNHNNERDTLRCLRSLAEVNYPDFEVIVVETSSNREHVKEIKEASQ